MEKLQDSIFTITKTTNLSPAVFSFLQPTDDSTDKTPLGGILSNTKHGWLALGPKFCVIDLRSGLKIAARVFGNSQSSCTSVTSVVELPTPLTANSQQLLISLECDDVTGMICVFHINGSQVLHCIQTDVVVTELAVCDDVPSGSLTCFDGLAIAGTRRGEVFLFDLNRACLEDALKNISQGHEDEIHNELNPANLVFLPLKALNKIESQRDLAVDNHDHLALLLNENSFADGQYIFRNPDGTVRMKANRDHVRVTVVHYIPQLASITVGYNFGAFQIWNLMNLDLEFTSQVNVECLPVTHFGFQEPCDDPRAFCYLWVVFSVIDRFEEEEFPLAVMYSLTYQGKRMMSETSCLYQEFSMATIRFQLELGTTDEASQFVGGRCVSCHTYSVNSALADDEDDTIYTNICQLVWECWGEREGAGAQHGLLLFDLDQWYKDQMPATHCLESNAFMSVGVCSLARGARTLDLRLDPASVAPYAHATRLEEHFYPNSLQYTCVCLNTCECVSLRTAGVQRRTLAQLAAAGPAALIAPRRLRAACARAGLAPLCEDAAAPGDHPDEQRRYLLSVALEARLSGFLKRCAHDWATGTHSGSGCTLTFLVDWCWKRAIQLKEYAKELTAPLFTSCTLPDRNVVRCLEHCVQQLTQLTGLLDAILTKCCNLVVPDALSEMEEKFKGIGTVSLYFQVVQWFLRVGLLPEQHDAYTALPYPAQRLHAIYGKRRQKLQRLEDKPPSEDENESCSLLYIDQLIENEIGSDRTRQMWADGGGLYPPPALYSLLRVYLLPDVAEEHKHSLVLYLLLDYCMVYDDIRYEAVIRRLMQFPTMFGLSNTAIKATQAFWHLDHRDFDFALDQLQCLTGNTLSRWQHGVALSSLLAQKKTQAALQYLHVRKPAPVRAARDMGSSDYRLNDDDKAEEWQACCALYLARGLVAEALDVARASARAAADAAHPINYFYKGCRNTGQLASVLNVTLLPYEEELFIKYLQNCNEPQTSDILIMYYLQQGRYLEAQQYNNRMKSRGRPREVSMSVESLAEVADREGARDALVETMCAALPPIATSVARCAQIDFEPHIVSARPMSVYVQASTPRNTLTYKSSFIQDTIENASETWVNKPQMRRGIKRALEVEETPFICTPKLCRTKSLFSEHQGAESTPPKRAKLDLNNAPRTPKAAYTPRDKLSEQLAELLDMPEVRSPGFKPYSTRSGTPQSILKTRRATGEEREEPSPADSRSLADSDDELLDTNSNHTHCSDSKQLRFTIPTASEASSTPSPVHPIASIAHAYKLERDSDSEDKGDEDGPSAVSPPKRLAVEEVKLKKTYKDTVKARRSLSISTNSSLSEDPNDSVESIADLPITLINPKYTGSRRERTPSTETEDTDTNGGTETTTETMEYELAAPKSPRGRRGIRQPTDVSAMVCRSRSVTPERRDSPIPVSRVTRSRSRTPELSPRLSPLPPIPEQPRLESNSGPHAAATALSVPRPIRHKSKTPERVTRSLPPGMGTISESTMTSSNVDALVSSPTRRSLRHRSKTPERIERDAEVSKLETIKESAITSSSTESPPSSPSTCSLRSRSHTPELEAIPLPPVASPRSMRSRSKTPEKMMSPKKDSKVTKKSLSRIVLEANAFAKSKQNIEKTDGDNEVEMSELTEENLENVIECTPMKSSKEPPKLMDVSFSPIVNKSLLQNSSDSVFAVSSEKMAKTDEYSIVIKPLPMFPTITETYAEKSVLHSYQSTIIETSSIIQEEKVETLNVNDTNTGFRYLTTSKTINETELGKSLLKSVQSSIADSSMEDSIMEEGKEVPKTLPAFNTFNETEFGKSVLRSEDNSAAITSDESVAKEITGAGIAKQNMSSLITDDSDIDMKEWCSKMDSQETARVIQKEKEKIVEIQQEINEIEDDMSNICQVEESESDQRSVSTDLNHSDPDSSESNNESESEESKSVVTSIVDLDEESTTTNSDTESQSIENIQEEEEHEETERNDNEKDNIEMEVTEDSTDPLNQAQISMMTDDNSVQESESVNLNYSDEVKPDKEETYDAGTNNIADAPVPKDVQIEIIVEAIESPIESTKESSDVYKGMDVVDFVTSDQYREENVIRTSADDKQTTSEAQKSIYATQVAEETTATVEAKDTDKEITISVAETVKTRRKLKGIIENRVSRKKIEETLNKKFEKPAEEIASGEIGKAKDEPLEKIDEENTAKEADNIETATPKRTKYTSSTKQLSKDTEKSEIVTEAPKTPRTRRNSKSSASNKSVTEDKPSEDVKTPKGRTTPTVELRTILTRRASKELSEKHDDSDINPDDVATTPAKRATRSKSKRDEDTASLASEGTAKGRASPARKGRKKTDLSVIPEVTTEETSSKDTLQEIIDEYSGSRRLTRHQIATLGMWVEPKAVPRRGSVASHSDASLEGDDDDATIPAFDVQPLDRITLRNTSDFQGAADGSESERTESPLSFLSESRPRNRLARAASESKTTPKAARVTRKASVDVGALLGTPETSSPAGGSSPSRGRRASFNKACEALHTPKGRRTSTDVKNAELSSPPAAPATSEAGSTTPSRRSRQTKGGKRTK